MGKEKVRLSVVDENNLTLAVMDIPHSSLNLEPQKKPHYFKKLERRYARTKPTGWIRFAKFIARILFKQS